jgi:dynein light intermediate chain
MNRKTQLTLGRQDDELFVPSTIPSTQDDMKQLEERFDMMLYKELALEGGLCPKRRRIYDDLFNELIRITKVHCTERGLLLERIRNEHTQWMNTYEELYSSSMGYSMRQYLYKMEEKKNFESSIETLENDCQQLRDELAKEENKFQDLTEQVSQKTRKEDKEQRTLINNIKILKSSNKKIRRDVEHTLNQILSSTIFLGEPIDYEKKKTTT